MILSRLKHAIREQNWFAVVLEMLIVIVGVVVGFQITAWGQGRQDAAQEQAVLEELRVALESDFRVLSDQLDAYHTQVRKMNQLSDHFDRRGPYADTLDAYFGVVYGLSIVTVNTSPYESLKSRGLGLISDAALRSDVTRLYDLSYGYLDEIHKTQRSAVLDLMRPYFLNHFEHMVFGVTATPYAYDQLLDDPYFRNLLAYRQQIIEGTEIPSSAR